MATTPSFVLIGTQNQVAASPPTVRRANVPHSVFEYGLAKGADICRIILSLSRARSKCSSVAQLQERPAAGISIGIDVSAPAILCAICGVFSSPFPGLTK